VRRKLQVLAAFFLAALCGQAARLTPPAEQAFAGYIASLEARLAVQHAAPGTYLAAMTNPEVERQLLLGGVPIEPVNGGTWQVCSALMHHWRAAAFVPGVNPEEMLALLRDPGHLSRYYAPQVVSSRALAANGKTGSLIRFKKQKVVTVVLDAEFESENGLTGEGRGFSISRSTHIRQVEDAGTPREHRRPEGDDDGFLWHLNSYWSFAETPGGLFIECEAVSLTRNVPLGLGWLINPIIQSLPRESLEFTLKATKNALLANARKEAQDDRSN
jgi:hypothetical protein